MPKDLNISNLLDVYGAMLTEKQRELLGLYYNEDLSLSEISELVGTSRQGVMDIIHRGEAQLTELENKLALHGFKTTVNSVRERLLSVADECGDKIAKDRIYEIVKELEE